MWDEVYRWIGPDEGSFDLEIRHMVLRAAVVFVVAVVIARLGSKRFMARNSAFDLILAIMLGSVLSRAITGQSPFFPTLAAGACLVAMHALFAWLASRSEHFSWVAKGRARRLVEDGKVLPGALRSNRLGEGDLYEALRLRGGSLNIEDVKAAYLERNGDISFVMKKQIIRETPDD